MSLINNMLKDLERREQGLEVNHYLLNPKNTFKKLIMLTLTSIMLILFAVMLIISMRDHNNSFYKVAQFEKLEPLTVPPKTTPLQSDAMLQPAMIDNMRLDIKNNIAEITLLLNSPVLYRIATHKDSHQLLMTIEHSRLQANVPQARGADTGIEDLHVQTVDDNTVLSLTLMQDAEIKNINLTETNNRPELIISVAINNLKPKTLSDNAKIIN